MNYSTAIFLINNNARAIRASYEEDGVATIFKTLDPSIDVDDLVVVETNTRHRFTVCKVVEVDVDIDMENSTKCDWIVASISIEDHKALLVQEAQAVKAIKSAELRNKREALRDAMFKDHQETLKALPIAHMNGDEPKEETETT